MRRTTLVAAAACVAAFAIAACTDKVDTPATVPDSSEHARMGSHGMVVIGREDLLLSHLPLYRAPHDRQILTPAVIADAAISEAFRSWHTEQTDIVTIVPENFDLNRLAPDAGNPIDTIVADIYAGHFERGGHVVFEDVRFNLSTPILHRAVREDAEPTVTYTYIEHGNAAYLVRSIGPRPGMDRILSVTPRPDVAAGQLLLSAADEEPPGHVTVSLAAGTATVFDDAEVVYVETADFAATADRRPVPDP